MITIIVVCILLVMIGGLILGFKFGRDTALAASKAAGATIFDVKQNYLAAVNEFILIEARYELHKWINNDLNARSPTGVGSFAETLKDTAAVTNKISVMTSLIFTKMSSNVKNAFYRIYAKEEDEDSGEDIQLIKYISRYLMFMVRRLTVDLTSELDEKSEKSFSDILKDYYLAIENEIYNNNGIYIANTTQSQNE